MTRSTRNRILLVAATLTLGLFLLRGASVYERAAFERTMVLLDELSAADAALDAEVLRLAYALEISYDKLSRVQTAMLSTLAELQSIGFSRFPMPVKEVESKLMLSEDFKTEFAVRRNSVAIASALAGATVEAAKLSPPLRADIHELENGVWRYIADPGQQSSMALSDRLAALDSGGIATSSAASQWPYLRNHVRTILSEEPIIKEIVHAYFDAPIQSRIQELRTRLRSDYARTVHAASFYGIGLFGLTLALLGYGARKAFLVHRYVGLLQESNSKLEDRVQERTKELQDANEALAGEMKERSEMEIRLRLAQRLEAIGQLAAGVAHEINTPCQYVSDNLTFVQDSWKALGPLLSACQAAADESDAQSSSPPKLGELWERADGKFLREEVVNAITESHQGMRQIRDTVRALRDFSEPDSGEKHPAEVNRLISNALMVARNEYRYVADVKLMLAEPSPVVMCLASPLSQVLLNLIVNAGRAIEERIKATPGKRGCITIQTSERDGDVLISIADDGVGIPDDIRAKIFDPFFTTKQAGKGRGRGLAIAHRVIDQHRGRIELASTPGAGANFTLRVPAAHGVAPNAPTTPHLAEVRR